MAPVLPKATSLTYFAEGGANVLYRIGIPTSSTMDEIPPTEVDHYGPATPQPTALEAWQVDLDQPDHSYLKGNLLRLRKDLPTVTTILEGQRDFHDHIEPLFEEDEIVMQTLIEVPQETVDQLNAVLAAMDNGGYRPQVFSGVYLARVRPAGKRHVFSTRARLGDRGAQAEVALAVSQRTRRSEEMPHLCAWTRTSGRRGLELGLSDF